MDRSNSLSSNASSGSRSGSSAPFAYQTRLLERTSSRSGTNSLSRSNSQSSISLLTNTTGSSVGSVTPRRWTPSHRVGNSLDIVRGRWEERSREALSEDAHHPTTSPTREPRTTAHNESDTLNSTLDHHTVFDRDRPLTPTSLTSTKDTYNTPKYLKRQTLPAPIIASPLSPNATGISVEADSPLSDIPHRIHIPVQFSPTKSPSWHANTTDTIPNSPVTPTSSAIGPSHTRIHRARTLDSTANNWLNAISPRSKTDGSISPLKSEGESAVDNAFTRSRNRFINSDTSLQNYSSSNSTSHRPRNDSATSIPSIHVPPPSPGINTSTSIPSVMHPSPYRSSYVARKKADSYSETLSLTGKRKLGNHLPRIASGDADESWVAEQNLPKKSGDREERRMEISRKLRDRETDKSPTLSPSGVYRADGVAGLPGRISLKAPSLLPTPTPSSRLLGGSWADKQRHLLQAYEYLCHVGEAQQWIEGCLGEELGFGVVEMEEGLRNGVVLAKLVRAFQGESAVRRIYEVSILVIHVLPTTNCR